MPDRSNSLVLPASERAWSGLMLLLGAVLAWMAAMAPQLVSMAMFGPICLGHGSAFALHCPTCYAAGALAVLGIALLASARPASGS